MPAPCPATEPQAPFRTLQVANRLIGKIWVGRARAETARRLQRMLKTNGDVPPVQRDSGRRYRRSDEGRDCSGGLQ
jgi:hypothetical protein